jgi:hypothetical protein
MLEAISGDYFIHLILTTMKKLVYSCDTCDGVLTCDNCPVFVNANRPQDGDLRQFNGVWFIYRGDCWVLDQLLQNVITVKNAGAGRIYGAHPVSR